jgi:sugar phosphate permease
MYWQGCRLDDVSGVVVGRRSLRGNIDAMNRLLIMAAIAALIFLPAAARAQERLGDGALGALTGALVGGPVGLVAGGVVGYTAGPAIASSWGLRGHRRYHRARYRRHHPQ